MENNCYEVDYALYGRFHIMAESKEQGLRQIHDGKYNQELWKSLNPRITEVSIIRIWEETPERQKEDIECLKEGKSRIDRLYITIDLVDEEIDWKKKEN